MLQKSGLGTWEVVTRRRHEEGFQSPGNVLFIDVGAGYMVCAVFKNLLRLYA